jgi:hypothetical protein
MADDFEQGGSKLYASLARSLADDPVVEALVGEHEPKWEAPLRLFGGVHYLELSGMVQHPWAKLRGVLEANREWLARFVAEQPIQTNEVQRCWGLLPAFLTVADGRRLDLIELGRAAGSTSTGIATRIATGRRNGAIEAPASCSPVARKEARRRISCERRSRWEVASASTAGLST